MTERPDIEWEQVKMSGVPLPHWMARVATEPRSVIFASVNQMQDGNWKVNFTPKGRGLHDPITYVGPYLSREKAIKQVERWAFFHWAVVPSEPPRDLAYSQRRAREADNEPPCASRPARTMGNPISEDLPWVGKRRPRSRRRYR